MNTPHRIFVTTLNIDPNTGCKWHEAASTPARRKLFSRGVPPPANDLARFCRPLTCRAGTGRSCPIPEPARSPGCSGTASERPQTNSRHSSSSSSRQRHTGVVLIPRFLVAKGKRRRECAARTHLQHAPEHMTHKSTTHLNLGTLRSCAKTCACGRAPVVCCRRNKLVRCERRIHTARA